MPVRPSQPHRSHLILSRVLSTLLALLVFIGLATPVAADEPKAVSDDPTVITGDVTPQVIPGEVIVTLPVLVTT